MGRFDLDTFVEECRAALGESEPLLAIKAVLTRAVAAPAEVQAALPATCAELAVLHSSAELTVMKAVWAPRMALPPHNHLMWGALGVYGGKEDNRFFRRDGDALSQVGGKEMDEGDVALLGADVIHSVTNPRTQAFTSAIHVYGGDFMHKQRSVWPGSPPAEQPATGETMQRYFTEANSAMEQVRPGP